MRTDVTATRAAAVLVGAALALAGTTPALAAEATGPIQHAGSPSVIRSSRRCRPTAVYLFCFRGVPRTRWWPRPRWPQTEHLSIANRTSERRRSKVS